MKIAIIGAGVSGLSCAYELERRGISPVIFEKKDRIGEALEFSGLWSKALSPGMSDSVKRLERKYGLALSPMSELKMITFFGPTRKAVARGNLGYIFKRGVEKYSLENQIASKVKAPVLFSRVVRPDDLKDDFTHIVVATGDNVIACRSGIWTDRFIANVRVATVLGNFKPDAAILWLNTKFSKNAFAYLIPNSLTEASLVLVVNGISYRELDHYWKEFLHTANIRFPIVETRDTEHRCGDANPCRIGRIYFTGNTGGFTDDLVGFGALNAVESGIMAARSIVTGEEYDRLVDPIYQDVRKLHELRKMLNRFDNTALDRFVGFIGTPGIKQFIYRNPVFKFKYLHGAAGIYNRFKGDKFR